MLHKKTLSTLALVLGLTACGGSLDAKDAAYEAFAAQDFAKAAKHFETALAGLTKDDPDYRDLKVDHARALAWVDAEKVPAATQALASEVSLEAKVYRTITIDLVSARAFKPAVEVMDLGMKAFPDDQKMAQVKDKVIEESKKAGDKGALEALAGMGYLGGD